MTTPITDLNDEQIRALPVEQLADALTRAHGAADNARRGAVHLLVGYGDMALLRLAHVRAYIVAAGDDGPLVQWSRLARHLEDVQRPDFAAENHATSDPRRYLGYLSSTARDALVLACSLADNTYAANLRGPAGRFGTFNRVTVVEALAIAFGIRPGVVHVPGPPA